MTERWMPVVGFEELYEVSDMGSVRSLPRSIIRVDGKPFRRRGQLLKPERNKNGHLRVTLSSHGETTRKFVHVLILESFVGPRPDGHVSCHWNDVPDDNRLDNLRWGTHVDNGDDMVRNGSGFHTRKTHCAKSHPYDEGNTYIKRGSRNGKPTRCCMTCNREAQRSRRESMSDQQLDEWRASRRAQYQARKVS